MEQGLRGIVPICTYIKESSLFALRNGGNPWSSRALVYDGRVPVACQLGRAPPSRALVSCRHRVREGGREEAAVEAEG